MSSLEFKKLEWDSNFFSLNISKVVEGKLRDDQAFLEIENYFVKNKIDLLCFEKFTYQKIDQENIFKKIKT